VFIPPGDGQPSGPTGPSEPDRVGYRQPDLRHRPRLASNVKGPIMTVEDLPRQTVRLLAAGVVPADEIEAAQQQQIVAWIDSGAPLFRTVKPATPPQHLAVYFALLWVPEIGGAIDPGSDAHDLVMALYGGMSKGERNRIKIRVRSAMRAQTEIEGRFLGGRPPYGYRLADVGPHPNPAKAAQGRQLHRLEPDPVTAPVVQRIFTEYVAGRGMTSIARGLTNDGIACPSAYDRKRNPHRRNEVWETPRCEPSCSIRGTPVGRSGTSSAPTRSSSMSRTSLSGMRTSTAGTIPPTGCGRRSLPTLR
jgi:hypothetical protein